MPVVADKLIERVDIEAGVKSATVDVSMGDRSYPIIIQNGSIDTVGEHASQAICHTTEADGRVAAIITNPKIGQIYGERVSASLTAAGFRCLPIIAVQAGERYKTLATVERIYRSLYDGNADRRGVIIALGGGVIGDVAGFVASSYLRGIDLVQVPTTLLSQVDSSVGGKVGVNYRQAKNSIGAFYQPKVVVIDPLTLASLPKRERLSGMAEVIKYGIIADRAMFTQVADEAQGLLDLSSSYLTAAIARSCEIKARVVEADEHETTGLRATLNFGHTVGHALEAVTNYKRYTHGEAIAIGGLSAALIGERIGITPAEVVRDIARSYEAVGFKIALDSDLDIDEIIKLLAHDKKSVGGEARFVLIDRIGNTTAGHRISIETVKSVLETQRAWHSAVK